MSAAFELLLDVVAELVGEVVTEIGKSALRASRSGRQERGNVHEARVADGRRALARQSIIPTRSLQ